MSDFEDVSPCASDDGDMPDPEMFGFGREPRFSAQELAVRAAEDEPAANEEEAAVADEVEIVWPPESRVGNTEWCECSHCCSMPTPLNSICCQDAAVILELARSSDVSCICLHSDFTAVVLHRMVLIVALRGYFERRQQAMPTTEQPDNRSLRYAAYRQYTLFVHGKLGRHVRCRIPSCAVSAIRRTYPNPCLLPCSLQSLISAYRQRLACLDALALILAAWASAATLEQLFIYLFIIL
eukprot:scpid100101/ scgid6300/ 